MVMTSASGVKESWTKLFTVMQPFSISSFKYERPVAYSKSGGEVLLEQFRMEDKNQRLVWYDLKNDKIVKIVKIQGAPDKFHADICWKPCSTWWQSVQRSNSQERRRIERRGKKKITLNRQ